MWVARDAEEFLREGIPQLKMTANDRSQDVRMSVVKIVEFWLTNMDINSLLKLEKDLVLILLNGMSEELVPEIAEISLEILDRHGTHMKEALAKLEGEEEKTMED